MKRWSMWMIVGLILTVVGGAAYLGLRSAQADEPATPQKPDTVAVTRGDVQQSVTAPGYLVSTQETVLGAAMSGRLDALHVRPGDAVQVGDLLAELEVEPLLENIAQARVDLALAQLRLAEAVESHARQLAQKQQDLTAAQLRLARAERDAAAATAQAELALSVAREQLARLEAQRPDFDAAVTDMRINLARATDALERARYELQKAVDRTWEPPEVRDAYARALQEAQWAHESAQARYAQALAALQVYGHDLTLQQAAVDQMEGFLAGLGGDVDPLLTLEIERIRQELAWLAEGPDPLLAAEVDQAQRTLDRLLTRVADAQLVAPVDGVVLQVMVRPGDAIPEGTPLILIASLAAVEARTTVIEEDLPLVQLGQPVDLFFDARPEVTVVGHVTRIVPQREPGSDRPLYPVYISADELPDGLALGMTVDASIITAGRSGVLRLPRTLVRARADGTGEVKVWVDGQIEERTIQVGLRGDVYIEILAGLQEGEEVVGG
jgi:multidrug efflux pump subunit AcrA (membrane-fusion protein)